MEKIKKILTGKSISNWVIFVFGCIIAALGATGWKIVYNPQLESSWNAVSAIGGWISAIISGIAIWFAVAVPKKISDEQNKIALFEKRFESYNVFLKYISFAETIYPIDSPNQLRQAFVSSFIKSKGDFDVRELALVIKDDEIKMMEGLFLFSDFCDGETINILLQRLLEVASLVHCEETFFGEDKKKIISDLCANYKEFDDRYMNIMRKQMQIGNE